MATEYRKELEKLLDQLKTERDQINVKLHLAKADARDEWAGIEKQWLSFKNKSEIVLKEVDQTSGEVKEALKKLGDELRAGFQRIKQKL